MYVPEKPTASFIGKVGEAAARALSSLYHNEHIMVPMGPAGATNAPRRIADEGIAAGLSVPKIARLSGLSERTIWRRVARLRAKRAAAGAPPLLRRRYPSKG